MIKIIYDFDIEKINNYRFYNPLTHEIDHVKKEFTSNLLIKHDSIYAFQYIGGGYDSVCFVENRNQSFYIIEPANGLIIAHDLFIGLIEFEKNRMKNSNNFEYTIGSVMSDTIFRSHRNDDEIFVEGRLINNYDIKKIDLLFRYANSSYEFKCKYIDFVPELLRFGERMMHLYGRLLPDFKEYALYPKLKELFFGDNILRQKYGHLMELDNLGMSFVDYISPPFDGM